MRPVFILLSATKRPETASCGQRRCLFLLRRGDASLRFFCLGCFQATHYYLSVFEPDVLDPDLSPNSLMLKDVVIVAVVWLLVLCYIWRGLFKLGFSTSPCSLAMQRRRPRKEKGGSLVCTVSPENPRPASWFLSQGVTVLPALLMFFWAEDTSG